MNFMFFFYAMIVLFCASFSTFVQHTLQNNLSFIKGGHFPCAGLKISHLNHIFLFILRLCYLVPIVQLLSVKPYRIIFVFKIELHFLFTHFRITYMKFMFFFYAMLEPFCSIFQRMCVKFFRITSFVNIGLQFPVPHFRIS